jgi:two-component system invasion response regulator UvrY
MRVLIVDDHPIIISGCRAMLAQRGDVEVIQAADGEAGIEIYFKDRPDIIVVDISLPGMSGFELMRRIRDRDPEAKIIVFTMNDDPVFAIRSIERGAKAYVTKNGDPTCLIDAIGKVAKGGVYLSAEVAQHVAFYKTGSNPIDRLNAREIEIIRLLGIGKNMPEIALALNISYKTVANTCSLMKQKLAVRSPLDLVRIAVENRLCP